MKLVRLAAKASAIGGLSLILTGTALADSDVTLGATGADSSQEVSINNTTQTTTHNTNVVIIENRNVQEAVSGDVTADRNTSVGGLSSGDATNASTTTTTVAIGNQPVGGMGGNTQTPVASNSGGSGSGTSTVTETTQPAGGRGGGVLGAATGGLGGGAVLPSVGASIPMDVSALRDAWRPATEAPTAQLVDGSRSLTAAMLAIAALLSLMGALGTALYARRRQGRVS